MFVVAAGTGIVGRERCRDIAVAIPHFAQVSRARHDVVAWVVRIAAEAMTDAQARPGIGHDLHQSHGSGRRDRAHVARALDAQHGANPVLGNTEALRGFGDEAGIGIGRIRARDGCGLRR